MILLRLSSGCCFGFGCGGQVSDQPATDVNPFFIDYGTPFDVQPFDRIDEADFVPEIMGLARVLQSVGRTADVATVMARVEVTSDVHRQLGMDLADELRRGGHWREAQVLYEQLRKSVDPKSEAARQLRLLQAYTDWHLGSDLRAKALLSEMSAPAVETEAGGAEVSRGRSSDPRSPIETRRTER